MTPDQWDRIQALFQQAKDLSPNERAHLLDRECEGQPEIRAEVESLLSHHDVARGAPDEAPTVPRRHAADDTVGPDARVGQTIAQYRIRRVIMRGGMGTVYEAIQDKPHRKVALKLMRAGIVSKAALRRFEFESQIASRLRHPAIAQVYDAGTHDEGGGPVPYFVMEYVVGARAITEYAKARDLDVRARLELFVRVCRAVEHAHQKGIIHRDLKPDNILIDSAGDPKIIDFGVARSTDSDVFLSTDMSIAGQLIGTLQYMSPEQCGGDPEELDTRADVYALGMVLYELMCGSLPYHVSKVAVDEAMRVIRQQSPPRLSSFSRVLRGDLETIAQKALEKEKARRYRSASDLGDELQRFLDGEPITARPASVVYQLRMMAKRHRAVFGSAAAVVAGIVIALGGTIWGLNAAIEARELADDRFTQVRDLANVILWDVYDEIQRVEGSTAAREMIAAEMLEYLKGLEAGAGDDPDLLREVSDGYRRLGDVTGGMQESNLGRRQEALAHYRVAHGLRQRLADADPGNVEAQLDLATIRHKIGVILYELDRFDDALTEFLEAETIAESLSASGGNDDALSFLATAHQSVGDVYRKKGDAKSANDRYAQVLDIKRSRARSRPDDRKAQRDLAVLLTRLGYEATSQGNPDEGLAYYEEGRAIRKKLFEADRENATYRRDYLVMLPMFIGEAHRKAGDTDTALAVWREALGHAQQRCEVDPENARAKNDLQTLTDLIADAESSPGGGG
jgi:tetratricopeptide (TPR) repeat protein